MAGIQTYYNSVSTSKHGHCFVHSRDSCTDIYHFSRLEDIIKLEIVLVDCILTRTISEDLIAFRS